MARVRARRNRLSSPTSVIALPRNIPPRWRGGMFALAANSLPASSPPPCRTPVAPPEHTPSPQTPPSVSPRPCLGARWRPRLCLRPQRSHPCGRAEKFRERTPEANRCETATLASEGFPFFRRKKLTRTVCTTRHSLLTDRIIYHSTGYCIWPSAVLRIKRCGNIAPYTKREGYTKPESCVAEEDIDAEEDVDLEELMGVQFVRAASN